MSQKFDAIIFGASGYTGKYAVQQATKIFKNIKWAVAGRSEKKLQKTLDDISEKTNKNLKDIQKIIADVNDENSLKQMTAQAKVLVNCCGPYVFYGEQVVKACIETSTNYLDVSSETIFMEKMQLKYDKDAREKGIYIISACGFVSIPADLGICYLQEKFNGTVNSVEIFNRVYSDSPKIQKIKLTLPTLASLVYGLSHSDELNEIRAKLFTSEMPKFQPELKDKKVMYKSENRPCLPFYHFDRPVVERSQRYFYEKENQRPIQMRAYQAYENNFKIIRSIFFGIWLKFLSCFDFTRKLLFKFPEILSFGFATKVRGSDEENDHTMVDICFIAEGWKEKQNDASDQFTTPMNKKMVMKTTVRNFAFQSTCDCLLLSAMMILNEKDKMPKVGGVLTPAIAFRKTTLIEELKNYGITFNIVEIE